MFLSTKMPGPVVFVSAVMRLGAAAEAAAAKCYEEHPCRIRCAGTKTTGRALCTYMETKTAPLGTLYLP